MSEPRNRANVRTYIIEFKDGSHQRIGGLDIAIATSGNIHSTSTEGVLLEGNFLAFRLQENRDTILISVDTIKSIIISDKNING